MCEGCDAACRKALKRSRRAVSANDLSEALSSGLLFSFPRSFAFIEFVTRADAERALAATNNWPFDASHTLHVYHYEAAKELLSTPDAYVPPRPHVLTVGSEPLSWLMDPAARDQFLITWHNQLREPRNEVLWSDARSAPALQFAGGEYGTRALEAWTSALSLRWSPQGTYLASLHAPGVRLWSGRDFEYGIGFKHDGVRAVSRSHGLRVRMHATEKAPREPPDCCICTCMVLHAATHLLWSAPHLLHICSTPAPHLLHTCSASAPHLLHTCPHLLHVCSHLLLI